MRTAGVLLLVVLAVPLMPALGQGIQRLEMDLPPHGRLVWQRGGEPVLEVRPGRGDGWLGLAERLCRGVGDAARLREANPRLEHPLRDRPVVVPLVLLGPELRADAVRRLFPADRPLAAAWEHRVLDPFGGGEESWAWLAEVFTGERARADWLRRANPAQPAGGPRRGLPVLVPAEHLLPGFGVRAPAPRPTPRSAPAVVPMPTATAAPTVTASAVPTPAPEVVNGVLQYGTDRDGEYAAYRLRRGEALYSAVVVRFTGQLHAAEVNATALEIARRSGIDDVTAIPVGYPVRIPVDLLLPEYLPAGHPRRAEWEAEQRELARFVDEVRAVDLSGVHIVLDAGHGGIDSGAVVDGVWESTYVYDIMCRIKRNLERHTRATVWTTVRDASRGYDVPAKDRLIQDRDQVVLTRPPYALEDSFTGVHLRWYLSNAIIAERERQGVPASRTVFLSVHADSLHPSVRGAMVYVPGRSLRPESFGVGRRSLSAYAEYRACPTVTLPGAFCSRAEASSRRLANHILGAIGEAGMPVHPYEPVRDRVLRGRRSWVPAVLRYSTSQHALLLECCNMANDADRANLLDQEWRERYARAVVAGLASAFDADG